MLHSNVLVLSKKGKILGISHEKSMERIEELLGECRLQGYTDLRDIYYAILEQDGQLSIVPRASKQPLCAEDVQLTICERGMAHPIILDGRINKNHLAMIGKNIAWLEKVCKQRGVARTDVFLLTVDDADKITLIPREKKK